MSDADLFNIVAIKNKSRVTFMKSLKVFVRVEGISSGYAYVNKIYEKDLGYRDGNVKKHRLYYNKLGLAYFRVNGHEIYISKRFNIPNSWGTLYTTYLRDGNKLLCILGDSFLDSITDKDVVIDKSLVSDDSRFIHK